MAILTRSIAASTDDAIRFRDDPAYPPVLSPGQNDADQWLVPAKILDGSYQVVPGFVRFDTASIPDDATVTAASLEIHVNSVSNANSRSINSEWYNWTTLSDSDWIVTPGTTAATQTIASLVTGRVNVISLSSPAANINLTGFTGLRLGISGAAPTGYNEVYCASWDHATLPAPRLVVTYTEFMGSATAAWLTA